MNQSLWLTFSPSFAKGFLSDSRGLDRATFHDRLLDFLLPARALHAAGKGPLVALKVIVRGLGSAVALARARGRALLRALFEVV